VNRPLEADVVVVGSGIAGLATALAASREAVAMAAGRKGSTAAPRILILTPGRFGGDGASAMAQGGIAAALDPEDSPALHALDTARAGGALTVAERVEILAAEGPDRVRELARMGVRFDRTPEGGLALGLEGAHSRRRIVHALGDRTGWEVTRVLAERALRSPGLRILEGVRVTGLRTDSGSGGPGAPRWRTSSVSPVLGVRYVDHRGEEGEIAAPLTLLATGGACRLFLRTTAPRYALGDGLALAAMAGARLDGMEFVQFHPTALRVEADPLPLVTEALRGEGALLVDAAGCRLLDREGTGGDLASRAEVTRRLWLAMQEGIEPFLDAREAVGEAFPRRFPGVHRICREHGIDPVRDLIPVTPAAHYHMGGVAVDAWGRTSVPGLRAAGEVASTGIHGANRLASNSLLEGLVYGTRAGYALVRDLDAGKAAETVAPRSGRAVRTPASVSYLPASPPPTAAPHQDPAEGHPAADRGSEDLLLQLRTLLWEGMGVVREAEGLRGVLSGLDRLEGTAAEQGASVQASLARPLLVARAMTRAALARDQSLGSHIRSDALPEIRAGRAPFSPPARAAS
jgi:L-aspartate oxidase